MSKTQLFAKADLKERLRLYSKLPWCGRHV